MLYTRAVLVLSSKSTPKHVLKQFWLHPLRILSDASANLRYRNTCRTFVVTFKANTLFSTLRNPLKSCTDLEPKVPSPVFLVRKRSSVHIYNPSLQVVRIASNGPQRNFRQETEVKRFEVDCFPVGYRNTSIVYPSQNKTWANKGLTGIYKSSGCRF